MVRNEFDIYDMWHTDKPLTELRDWLNDRIAEGHTKCGLNIEYGYYSDVDGLKLDTW